MGVSSVAPSFEAFLTSITAQSSFALLTDYDGTLAPFQVNRELARPYPEIPELLSRLLENGVHVSVVSGRPAHEVQRLLGISSIDVWGCHGAERLLPTGEYIRVEPSAQQSVGFELLTEALAREQLSSSVEIKPSGVAVHWRGLPLEEVNEARYAATRAFRSMSLAAIDLCEFDGGLEFRSRGTTKAGPVRQIRQELPLLPIVYIGDDLTDEDAFRALDDSDVSILVRPEYRPTAAQLWLKPPEQLTLLLHFLAYATGGSQ